MQRVFFFLAVALFIFHVECRAQEPETFSNPTFGFSVEKPSAWQVTNAVEYAENLQKVSFEDQAFEQRVQKYAQVPFMAFMKYPEPYDDVNPSFKVNIKPMGQFQGMDMKEILNALIPTFKQAFRRFEVVDGPRDVQISTISSAYMKIQYSLVVADGREFPTSSEIWLVPKGNNFFMIGVGRRQDAGDEDLKDINEIISSIKIE